MPSFRIKRIRELLKSFLGEQLAYLNEPELSLVTITDVDITADYKIATVYWSSPTLGVESVEFPTEKKIDAINHVLESQSNFFKKGIAQELQLRNTPKLIFEYDRSAEQGSKIDALLKKAGFS